MGAAGLSLKYKAYTSPSDCTFKDTILIRGKTFENVKIRFRVALKSTETRKSHHVLCVSDLLLTARLLAKFSSDSKAISKIFF